MEPGRAARILGAMAAAMAVAVVAASPAAVRAAPTLNSHEPIAARLVVTPTDGLSSSGKEGGPFSPISRSYTLFNVGESSLGWTAGGTENWVTASPPFGSLAGGDSTEVTVSINSTANDLDVGSHSDTVTFTNTTNGLGDTTRSVNLKVKVPPVLGVAPTEGLSSSGQKGGPFNPSSKTYTLFNTAGEFALSWTAVTKQDWVTVSPPSGSIPSGEIRNVEVSIHSSANSLPDGNYTDTLTFTNTTNGLGNTTRSINLTVFSPTPTPTPTHTPTPTPTPKPTPSPTPTPTPTPTSTPAPPIITTVAGNGTAGFSGDGGPATSASLSFPGAVAVDGLGNVYIADQVNERVRRVDVATGVITTVVGTGTGGSPATAAPPPALS